MNGRHLAYDFAAAILAKVLEMVAPPLAIDGVVQSGSWSPTGPFAGTAESVQGDTATIFDDDDDQALPHSYVPLATMAIGDQYGPRGGERSVLIHTQSGFIKLFTHGEDDSPGVLAGERGIHHRSAAGVYDAHLKLVDDGAPGDSLGGTDLLAGSKLTLRTAGGHTIVLDDAGKKITIETSGGLGIVLDDAAHVAELGAANLDPSLDAIATKRYVDAAIVTAFNSHTHGGVASGQSFTAPPATPMTFTGSQIAKAAP